MAPANETWPDMGDRAPGYAPEAWPATAAAIVRAGLWCVIESRDESAPGGWEPRLIVCRTELGGIAEAITRATATVPSLRHRIAGYTRDTLVRVDSAPTAVCHVPAPLAETA